MTTLEAEKALLPYDWPGSAFIGEEEAAAVGAVVEARSPFRYYGPDVQGYADRLEAAYRERFDQPYALAVNSCTAGLSIAMTALGIGPGDEVLVPGFSWVSCVAAVVRAGAVPRLVEIDESFTLNAKDLEAKVSPHTKAILVVHMSGAAADMDAVMGVAERHGLLVIEDVAQANGGSYKGRPLGSFGDAAVTSFQFNKNITAGEGGLFACRDEGVFRRAFAVHDLGYARNAEGRLDPDDPDVQLWGQGSRMGELCAAMLVAQERKLDTITSRMRRQNHKLYAGLGGVGGSHNRTVHDPAGDTGPFVILVWPSTEVCNAMVRATRDAGVKTGPKSGGNVPLSLFGLHLYYNVPSLVHKRPLNASGYPWSAAENAFAKPYIYDKGTLPVTDDLFARSSLLSVSPMLSDDACEEIIEIFWRSAAELDL